MRSYKINNPLQLWCICIKKVKSSVEKYIQQIPITEEVSESKRYGSVVDYNVHTCVFNSKLNICLNLGLKVFAFNHCIFNYFFFCRMFLKPWQNGMFALYPHLELVKSDFSYSKITSLVVRSIRVGKYQWTMHVLYSHQVVYKVENFDLQGCNYGVAYPSRAHPGFCSVRVTHLYLNNVFSLHFLHLHLKYNSKSE